MEEEKKELTPIEKAYERLKEQVDKYKGSDVISTDQTMQGLGNGLIKVFESWAKRFEARIEERFEKYDEGINQSKKLSQSAIKIFQDEKKRIMTVISTVGWVIALLSGIAGIMAFVSLMRG
jgi:hypothetical protein